MAEHSSRHRHAKRAVCAVFLFIMALIQLESYAQEAERDDFFSGAIRVTADSFTAVHSEGYAEFGGNVKASQNDAFVTSDTLKVWYDLQARRDQTAPDTMILEKIVAEGHVRISMNEVIGEGQRAVFTRSDRILVLSGEKALLKTGESTVTGSRIVINQREGSVKVFGGPGTRVEAYVLQEDVRNDEATEEEQP
ncbi:LptA/OstA family protein [Thermodesulfobacteriota bacterium]